MTLVPAARDVEADIDALLLKKHPYLIGKPAAFQQSADVLLVLDTGAELPVHSVFLSAHSNVFCEVLTATRPEDSGWPLRRLPLPDCSEEAVNALLLCLYAQDACQCLSIRSARFVSELAHKFGMYLTLRMCDCFLVSKTDDDVFWAGDLNKTVEWLVWAEKYGLPRFAVRAKRYAVDNGGNIATCPAAKQLSSKSLLWMLDARFVDKEDMEFLVEEAEVPPGISPDDTYVFYRKHPCLAAPVAIPLT